MSREDAGRVAQQTPRGPTLAQLMQASQNIVWFASLDPPVLVDINPAGLKAFDRPKSELLADQEAWLKAIHPDEHPLFEELPNAIKEQGSLQLEYRVVQPSGEIRWLRDNITQLPSKKGVLQLISGIATDVTDSVRSQQHLRESNDVLTGLIQQLPMNVLRKDLRGRIVFANQRYCDAINLDLDDLIGKTDFDLYPADLAKKYTDDDKRVMESGEAIEEFEQHQTADGNTAYVQVRKGPVWDADGKPIGLQIMFWDATDRKQAEAELDRERNLLHALLESGQDSIYFKDSDSRFIRVSRGLSEKFRLGSPEAAIGKSDADFFSEEHAQAALEDELEIMRGGEPMLEKEERETWGEGEDTWCSTTKMALRDPFGQIIGTFGISRDITDKKRAKEELGRERDLLKTIIDNVPDLIFVKDRAGRFILANAALLNVLGANSIDDVIGKTDYDFSQPELACEYVADDQNVMRSGEPLIDQEESSRGLDGKEVCLLMSKVPLRDREGKVRGLVGIGRDITRRKQEQESLHAAMELADKANVAKSDFLANMSHEIRTPLNAIIGMTDLVLDTELTATQQEFLSMVKESGATLLRVINDILDFSKIEAGKLELDPITFDLRDHLGNTMKSLAFRAHEKSLELALHIHPDVPKVFFGDSGRLRQIIVNLVANAIKFTEVGEVVVKVRCSAVSGQVAHLEFAVSDTGIGISKEKVDTIFNEFEQADTSTTRQYGGTGLGLAISTSLVELMGGRIWVDSKLGTGSTFHFSISLEASEDNGFTRSEPVVVGGTSVLIVDDNQTNRMILEEMVMSWGMLPVQADSAQSAQTMLGEAAERGRSFQLILSDVNMPQEDGFDLTRWVREHDELTSTPIIMLTSGGRMGDQAQREELQVQAHLTKPVKQSELFDTIVRVLGNGVAPEPSKAPGEPEQAEQPLRILLAEDSVFNQKLAIALLEKKGHAITVACNGRQAVELVQHEPFDMILMDVQMPEMDGLAATQAIRAWELENNRERVPIIAMTAHAFKGDREQCLDAGMDEYLSKPIDPNSLYSVIDSVVTTTEEGFVLEFDGEDKTCELDADAEVVDFAAALQKVGGSQDTLKALALILMEECPKLVEQIEQAMEVRDAKELQRAAHTLKGSSSHFQATHVVRAAEAMESLAISSEFEAAPKVLDGLKAEVGRLEEAIRARFMT